MSASGTTARIRVLIVDDSFTSRRLHERILASDPRFEVAGMASNGKAAIEMIRNLEPDVVSMDVQMPDMDGIEATRLIMQHAPVPIVIVSSLYDATQKELAIQAMAAGAVHIMPKPLGPGHDQYARSSERYLRMLKNMSEVRVVRRRTKGSQPPMASDKRAYDVQASKAGPAVWQSQKRIVVIGASAGGPEALRIILNSFDSSFKFPVVVVQHIDENFSETFREWLQTHSLIPVVLAKDGMQLQPAHVYLAPGGKHLSFKNSAHLILTDEPAYKGHKPSVSQLFKSAKAFFGNQTVAVLLSGMGDDGAEEMLALKNCGATTLAQDEASCLVFGMPGAAVKNGGTQMVGPPERIAQKILELQKL